MAFCLFLCACALLCKFCWPQGIAAVQDLLVGSEGGRVQRGVNAAAEAIREREPLGEVAEAFWQGLQSEAPA